MPRIRGAVLRLCLAFGRLALSGLSLSGGSAARAQQVVSFASMDDALLSGPTTLRGLLFKPAGEGPFPAVVALHGCGGLFNRQGKLAARETAWAGLLTARGYVVLFPDSFGPREVTGACADGGPKARPWVERAEDAYGALRYLQSRSFVIGERIGLIGWSHGGGTVAFTVKSTNDARPSALPKGDFRAAIAFYPGWCSDRWLGGDWSTNIPFLLEMGEADDWTLAASCVPVMQRAIERGAPVRVQLYHAAYHDFDWPGMAVRVTSPRPGKTVHVGENSAARADALERVPAFLDEYLKH